MDDGVRWPIAARQATDSRYTRNAGLRTDVSDSQLTLRTATPAPVHPLQAHRCALRPPALEGLGMLFRAPCLGNAHPDDGSGAKHSLISPRDATLYLTTSGRSFSKYISI